MTTKLDYTKWRELKATIYDALDGTDLEYRKNISDKLMSILEKERIIKLKEEESEPKERKEKPINYNKGKYKVEKPRAILSCGCSFDFVHDDNDELCDYHLGEANKTE